MVQAWNKNGRRAHSENSTDDRHTTKKAEMTTKDHMKDVCKRHEHCESQYSTGKKPGNMEEDNPHQHQRPHMKGKKKMMKCVTDGTV